MSQEEGAYIMIAAFTIVPFIVYAILNVVLYRVLTTLGVKLLYYITIAFLLGIVAFFISAVLYSESFSIIIYLPLALLNLYYAYSYISLVR